MQKELQLIAQLMEELKNKMEYGKDDFDERLGKAKPEVKIMKMEGKVPMDSDPSEMAEQMSGKDMDQDMEMGEDPSHSAPMMGNDMGMDPDEKLKARLMKMRGAC